MVFNFLPILELCPLYPCLCFPGCPLTWASVGKEIENLSCSPKNNNRHTIRLCMQGSSLISSKKLRKNFPPAISLVLNTLRSSLPIESIFGVLRNCQGLKGKKGKIKATTNFSCKSALQKSCTGDISKVRSATLFSPFNQTGVINLGMTTTCQDFFLFPRATLNCSIQASAAAGGGHQI